MPVRRRVTDRSFLVPVTFVDHIVGEHDVTVTMFSAPLRRCRIRAAYSWGTDGRAEVPAHMFQNSFVCVDAVSIPPGYRYAYWFRLFIKAIRLKYVQRLCRKEPICPE